MEDVNKAVARIISAIDLLMKHYKYDQDHYKNLADTCKKHTNKLARELRYAREVNECYYHLVKNLQTRVELLESQSPLLEMPTDKVRQSYETIEKLWSDPQYIETVLDQLDYDHSLDLGSTGYDPFVGIDGWCK